MDESVINRFQPYNVRDESGRVKTHILIGHINESMTI